MDIGMLSLVGNSTGMMRLGGPLPSPSPGHPPGRAPTDPEWRDPQARMPRRSDDLGNEGIMAWEQQVTKDYINESDRRLDLMTKRRRPF